MTRYVKFLLLTAALLAVGGCGKKVDTVSDANVPVKAAMSEQKTVPVEITSFGTVEAYTTVVIKSQVAGMLEKVHFAEGQMVKKGNPLFSIDARSYQAHLDLVTANLQRDTAQLDNADKEAKRIKELFDKGFASQDEYDTSATAVETLRAAVVADAAAIADAKLKVEYCSILAPCDGRTGNLLVHAGNVIKENDTQLVIINQISPIYTAFSINQRQLTQVQQAMSTGTLAVEAAMPKESNRFNGTLTFIDNTINPDTGTIRLKATFENKDYALWPGQFVNVTLIVGTQDNAVIVPSDAIERGQQGSFVFVVKPDMTVDSRKIEVDRTWGAMSIIRSGLVAGETVVTDGQLRLVPGVKVSFAMVADANEGMGK